MSQTIKRSIVTAIVLAGMSGSLQAKTPDSTYLKPGDLKPFVQTYMLDHGQVSTSVGNYYISVEATKARCQSPSTPVLITNINGVDWYGASQAIEGVVNNIQFNSTTYMISGELKAPVNIAGARPNGATANWTLWCKSDQVA